MSTTNGQPVTASVLNTAYASKTSDNTSTGKQTLNRIASGDQVDDVQLSINQAKFKTYATETISGGGTIASSSTLMNQYRRVVGNAAPVTLSITPFGAAGWVDGSIFHIVGTDNTNTVTIPNNDASNGFVLNGEAQLKKYYVLIVQYDLVLDRFIELGRNWA